MNYSLKVGDVSFGTLTEEGHILACPRVKARLIQSLMPPKWFAMLEQNQQLASCCRHPEDHDIEAWYSSPDDAAKGIPDIYIFHCTCGRQHRRFIVGGKHGFKTGLLGEIEKDADGKPIHYTELRPKWEVR
jgi:hypothetical protein